MTESDILQAVDAKRNRLLDGHEWSETRPEIAAVKGGAG